MPRIALVGNEVVRMETIDLRPVRSTGPDLPLGRRVELPGRGTTFVREVGGPEGAPTVLLLHGLLASGGLNWFQAFGPMGEHFRVVAPDHRGHGRGLRTRSRFRLADCADDAAALIEALGTGPVIAVGYSMGGPIAQLLWKRHPELVAGLVFCATSDRFVPVSRERLVFVTAMSAAIGTSRFGALVTRLPVKAIRSRAANVTRERPESLRAWAAAEMRRHDWRMVAEAARAIGVYDASEWIGDVDVPTTVLVTTEDKAISPLEQMRLLLAIRGAELQRIDDGHTVCARGRFGPPLVDACLSVASRIDRPVPSAAGAPIS
jgi:pimeloyl-ACP methyl ester carboxylesterase